MSVSDHLKQGLAAEHRACHYLQQQGLTLLQRNYRWRHGEIDLIMRDADTLVFIEVRYRRHQYFGGAIGSITPSKQQRLRATANRYLQQQMQTLDCPARFDVVVLQNDHGSTEIDWLQDVF